MQELKGNIRVFCRVRPLLPDDGAGTEMTAIAYPTSVESQGRGVDLLQNGNGCEYDIYIYMHNKYTQTKEVN